MKLFSKIQREKIRLGKFCALLAVLSFAFGCASYGELRETKVGPGEAPIKDWIDQNYDDFIVAYSGIAEKPGAITFDMKGDGVSLVGEGWQPVQDKNELMLMVDTMFHLYRRWPGPELWKILDQQGNKIGYFFSAVHYTPITKVGNNYHLDPLNYTQVRQKVNPIYEQPMRGIGGRR